MIIQVKGSPQIKLHDSGDVWAGQEEYAVRLMLRRA